MIVDRAEFVPATDEVRVVHTRSFADFDPAGVPRRLRGRIEYRPAEHEG